MVDITCNILAVLEGVDELLEKALEVAGRCPMCFDGVPEEPHQEWSSRGPEWSSRGLGGCIMAAVSVLQPTDRRQFCFSGFRVKPAD